MVARSLKRAALAPSADPNVIPFIDVLLVLLIIFMVTAPKPTVDLQVNLPRAGVSTPAPDRATIVDLREEDGALRVAVDGEEASFATLAERSLAHAASNNPQSATDDLLPSARILVRADQNTAYGNVVMVVDELQYAHFGAVGIFGQIADAD